MTEKLESSKENINVLNKISTMALKDVSANSSITSPQAKKEELKIIEWRFNQFLGEKLYEEEMFQEENLSYLISDMKMSNNGEYVLLGDRGGRIIIFKKGESQQNRNFPKLNYFYEFGAYDKDFDVHRSTEYSEMIRSMEVLPLNHKDKMDILSCGYRTIKLHRIHNSKIRQFNCDDEDGSDKSNEKLLKVPKVKSVKTDIASKCKVTIKVNNSSEMNSISYNKHFTNNFLTSDDTKALLWDINNREEVYNIIDLERERSETALNEDHPEKITMSRICDNDPHMFSFGTNYGNITLCDTRTNSECMKFSSLFVDEFQNITNSGFNLTKTIFSAQIMSVHDLNFNLSTDNLFASRHSLSINLWDKRNTKSPVTKFLVYEPVIPKLSYMYMKNYLAADKFKLSVDKTGKYLMTGGYSNMFHVFDIDQRLNTQISVDDSNEKIMNTNIIRKINSKGSCFYKKDDPNYNNIIFDNKISNHCYSNVENYIVLGIQNCIYTYNGNTIVKETGKKS
jgi:serine/threonine-protein phosphatase 2A regulatory subunit B